jgi:hypothetical protein
VPSPDGVGMSASAPKRSSAFARPSERSLRKLATITGLPWMATFITSLPAVLLCDPGSRR